MLTRQEESMFMKDPRNRRLVMKGTEKSMEELDRNRVQFKRSLENRKTGAGKDIYMKHVENKNRNDAIRNSAQQSRRLKEFDSQLEEFPWKPEFGLISYYVSFPNISKKIYSQVDVPYKDQVRSYEAYHTMKRVSKEEIEARLEKLREYFPWINPGYKAEVLLEDWSDKLDFHEEEHNLKILYDHHTKVVDYDDLYLLDYLDDPYDDEEGRNLSTVYDNVSISRYYDSSKSDIVFNPKDILAYYELDYREPFLDREVFFVTGNDKKFRELEFMLHPFCYLIQKKIEVVEIQGSPQEIIEAKFNAVKGQFDGTFFVEDTTLNLSALGGFPGPYVKHFMQELTEERIYNIVRSLDDCSAWTESRVLFYDAEKDKKYSAMSVTYGRIVEPLKGYDIGNCFGYDRIFVPLESNMVRTSSMDVLEKIYFSPRCRAMRQISNDLILDYT